MSVPETIMALATGAGKAGVAIIRLSGKEAGRAAEIITQRPLPSPRYAAMRHFYHPHTRTVLDHGLLLYFPAPHSFTGEDVVELHLHGGRAIIQSVLDALLALKVAIRLAEPGEFSYRAFLNGKMDLTQIEGLADLIDAETVGQHRQALRQLDGDLGKMCRKWREDLVKSLAYMEASIDFSDEEIPTDLEEQIDHTVLALQGEVSKMLQTGAQGKAVREGVEIVILGAPNTGKSSLMNWLARREVAIVSEMAGTTRDVIEVRLDLGGYPVTVIDTAGLRESGNLVEREGMRRALARAEQAEIVLWMCDANNVAEAMAEIKKAPNIKILLCNKTDRYIKEFLPPICPNIDVLPVSVHTGNGMDNFMRSLTDIVGRYCEIASETPVITRLRHQRALEETRNYLREFEDETAVELKAELIRLAARSLGQIIGEIATEEVLDEIFSGFCIGK